MVFFFNFTTNLTLDRRVEKGAGSLWKKVEVVRIEACIFRFEVGIVMVRVDVVAVKVGIVVGVDVVVRVDVIIKAGIVEIRANKVIIRVDVIVI